MIVIAEGVSKKLPTKTSLQFKVDIFSKDLYNILVQATGSNYDIKTNEYEFPVNKLFFLVNILNKYDDVKFIPYKEKVKKKVKLSKKDFDIDLYQHQVEGVEYGLNHNGWMLLDDQGLGKTLQIIELAEKLYDTDKLEHCLIICGVNNLKYNWLEEIKKFSKLSGKILGQRTTRTGKQVIDSVAERCKALKNKIDEFFVITNIETLQSKDIVKAFRDSKNKFDMIVLDEAHHCKNPSSQTVKNLLKFKSSRNIALSGTIILNTPEDSFIPLKWTGNTNSTYTLFKSTYNMYGGFGGVQVIGHKNLDLLQELIASCSLRRLKSEVLDLPSKTYIKEYVELGSKQRALYEQVSDGVAIELNKLDHIPTIMEEITINMRLRQITACPSMLSTDVSDSAKLDRLEELVEQIIAQGDKVVVFSTFKGTIDEAHRRLLKYNPVVVTGSVSDYESNLAKETFQNNPNTKVYIGTWQKCGTGITLTAASYLIFIDTPWTDGEFQQCADRIYRIGQSKPVTIITLIAKDTYDERVQEILDRKEVLSGYLIDDEVIDHTKINILEE